MSLYLVSTPIGNLDDITLRAIKVLSEVDMVFAEDTRRTTKLLNHLDIKKPINSYHEHSDQGKHQYVLSLLKEGKDIAICSDAGMPCIADPGQQLVFDAIEFGIKIIPIPGANAMLTALIASGLSTDYFAFLGFYPRKKDEEIINLLTSLQMTSVFYESPNRILETVSRLAQAFPQRKAVIARELTKIHEEFLRGTLLELCEILKERQNKGEFVLLIEPAFIEEKTYTDQELIEMVNKQQEKNISKKDAILNVVNITGEKKNRIYSLVK